MTELLAPAGNINIAYTAFVSGADAVYFGLQDFSARKGASNFDLLDLRKLKELSIKFKKKIYVTLNTVIKQDEMPKLLKALYEVTEVGVDAVIIQDLGVLHLIKTHFPALEVHASTQMALGTKKALDFAFDVGIKRVVLPRETTFSEIERLRGLCPEVELEVFIHGALCYSFSGLCLASGMLLDRSGNRGECAQLCRNFYEVEGKESYPLSMNDLFLGEQIKKLQDLKISSLKIEGRLKSEDYVSSTCKLYRYLLDTERNKLDHAHILKFEKEVSLSFSRQKTRAFFNSPTGNHLINPNYSKNLGHSLGNIESIAGKVLIIKNSKEVDSGDELLILKEGHNKRGEKIFVKKVRGDQVEFFGEGTFEKGDSLFLFRKKKIDRVQQIPRFELFKQVLEVDVKLEENKLTLKTTLSEEVLKRDYEVILQEKTGTDDLYHKMKELFLRTSESFYCLDINEFDHRNKFISPSVLKKIRNHFLEELFNHNEDVKQKFMSKLDFDKLEESSPLKRSYFFIGELPFAHQDDFMNLSNFEEIESEYYIPLHPILCDESYFDKLKKLVENNEENHFVIGLNNPAHLHFLKTCQLKNISYFIDYSLYIANSTSLDFIKRYLEGYELKFFYPWVEDEEEKDLDLPLMISKGCLKKNVFEGPSACQNCDGQFRQSMENNGKQFEIISKDCLNYIFLRN